MGYCNSQVTLDTTDLLLEYTVPEPTLKLSTSRTCRRDRHGVLSTTNDNLRCQLVFNAHDIRMAAAG
jgi:hypothetical protein